MLGGVPLGRGGGVGLGDGLSGVEAENRGRLPPFIDEASSKMLSFPPETF